MYVLRPVQVSALAREICSLIWIAEKSEFTGDLLLDCLIQTPACATPLPPLAAQLPSRWAALAVNGEMLNRDRSKNQLQSQVTW